MKEGITDWSEQEERTIRNQLITILESDLFTHSARLGRFLKFIVDETLDGRASRLNQYAIATDVFDRDETFDPSIDAIVRVEAGRLRAKLREYYSELGGNDSVAIELPKRGYAATFKFLPDSVPVSSEILASEVLSSGVSSFGSKKPSSANFIPISPQKTSSLIGPVIAVLPFTNISSDTEQEYFADGITEDLITDLSQLPRISVISRQSTFTYKNVPVTVQQVCNDLGANIVLEGSVRKLGERVRITAQLIDGVSGHHLWAERYDHNLDNLFDVQDEVNRKIVEALSLQLSEGEYQRLKRRGTDIIKAYDYVLRGMTESRANTEEGSARARYCFESALRLDPDYAVAYARLALNYIYRWILGWNKSPKESIDVGFELALKAVSIDDQLALAHAALCWAHLWRGEHDKAIAEGKIAIELDADDVVALERLALCMIFAGDPASSLPLIAKAKRLNPSETYNFARGVAAFMVSNYTEAIQYLQSQFELSPNFIPAGLYLAASHILAGNKLEAAATIAKIKQISPGFTLGDQSSIHIKDSRDRERLMDALRQTSLV